MNGFPASRFICTAATVSLVSLACVMNKLDPNPPTIDRRDLRQGHEVYITVAKGSEYSREMKAGPLTFNVLPQVVIWSEDAAGRLVETIYITGAGKDADGHADKDKKGTEFYRESFPVWAQHMTDAGQPLPGKNEPYPDAVTSATPMAGFTLITKIKIPPTPWSLYLEINRAGDNNNAYTKNNNDWAGQPSLIYRATFTDTAIAEKVSMELIGHGGRLQDTPQVYPDLKDIDSALNQIQGITVMFNDAPGN